MKSIFKSKTFYASFIGMIAIVSPILHNGIENGFTPTDSYTIFVAIAEFAGVLYGRFKANTQVTLWVFG